MVKPALAFALSVFALCGIGSVAADTAESKFLAESKAAMKAMMAALDVRPSGDVDRDFVEMMVPHHRAAIDMSIAELRAGRNERLRRMAQEIISTQKEETVAMRRAIASPEVRR